MSKRYEYCVNDGDCYRIADMSGCKTLEQFIEEARKEHQTWYTEEELKELAGQEYADYIYEHGLEGHEVIKLLNKQDQQIKALESVLEFATDTITEHCSKKRIKELQEYMKSEGVLLE